MSEDIKVLDHGYVRFVEAWGHGDAGDPSNFERHTDNMSKPDFECGIIEAARQSTQASFRGWEDRPCPSCKNSGVDNAKFNCRVCDGTGIERGDQRLLAYLFNGKPQHATPFEFAGMTIEVVDPTCVVWEWVRHRTIPQSDEFPGDVAFNIMSSRYGEIPERDYRPSLDRCLRVSTVNKQGGALKGSDSITSESAEEWLKELDAFYEVSQKVYKSGLKRGVPKEIARLALSFGRYWSMRVTGNLRNWLAFVTLRSDPNAQEEIRLYSQALEQIIQKVFPRTYDLFLKRRDKQ